MQGSLKAQKVKTSDYDILNTLGTGLLNLTLGSFGRVKLVKHKATGEFYALKALKKAEILRLKQVDHIISENTILAQIDHPFLVSF